MSETAEQLVTPAIIEQAMSYEEYQTMIDNLLNENKTTGSNHSEGMVKYTKMNVHRMNRLDKHTSLKPELKEALESVEQGWIWLVLTEAWCGDAAQNIPVIAKMADHNDNIDLKLILRDQHLDIMDQYLTNGGRSIPKLICLDAKTLEEIGSWGPRPEEAQTKAMKWKEDSEISTKEWAEKLHKWYADNGTEDIQEEFTELIKDWV